MMGNCHVQFLGDRSFSEEREVTLEPYPLFSMKKFNPLQSNYFETLISVGVMEEESLCNRSLC